jgi:uncharacterized membrane protein
MKNYFYILAVLITSLTVINACKHEIPQAVVSVTPVTGGTNEVCFESQILPIFQTNCAKAGCHDAATHADNYIFDTYANIISKDVRPGNASTSKVYEVLFETGNKKMPPAPNTDLTLAQKALIGRWINEGAKNTVNCNVTCDSSQFKYGANVSAILGTYCLGCHSGIAPSGGIDLSTYASVKNVATNGRLVGAVSHAPGYSAMPKNASKLSDCQIAQIRKWVNAGAPNN